MRLKVRLTQAFMFQALEEAELKIVLGAMQEVTYRAGDFVIK